MSKSNIIVPDRRLIVPTQHNMGLEGHYRLRVRRSDGSVKQDTGWFKNIITNIGLNRIGTARFDGNCVIGTGTATPAITDTALASFSAGTTVSISAASTSNSGSPLYEVTGHLGYRFNAGTLSGNYSEIGIGWANTSLFSRALILDGGGSPTTITVLSTEFLDVFYALKQVPDLTAHTQTMTIGGVSYSVSRLPYNVSNLSFWTTVVGVRMKWVETVSGASNAQVTASSQSAATTIPSGPYEIASSVSESTYVNNSYEVGGVAGFATTAGNLSGGSIKTLLVHGATQSYQYEFTPVLPKDNTRTLTITGKVSWARV